MIESLDRFEMPITGVYFLFKDNKLIYIGRSVNVFRRLYDHIKNKEFDSYSFIKCGSEKDADKLEIEMIKKYKPLLNIQHKTEDLDLSIEFHLQTVKKLQDLKTSLFL